MSIRRHEIRQISDENRGQPIVSQAVVHGNIAYFAGITPNPIVGDIKIQTAQVLRRVDELLNLAGTNKTHLLSAQVWIADMRLFEDHILFGTSGSIPQILRRGLASRPSFGDLGCSLKSWWLRPCHEPVAVELRGKAFTKDARHLPHCTEVS
jgi:Endoribonuclease L-PSP